MSRQVVLVRHGHSAHTERAGWIDAAGVERWRESYDAAGILDDSMPPSDLVALAARAGCVITSDLERAIASARRLAPQIDARVSPLLREMPLDIPRWVPARWPIAVWDACITAHWFVQEWRGSIAPPWELARATDAVAMLEEVVSETSSVLVVTHGAFRRLLAHRLVSNGWTAEPRVGGFRNWSSWPFRRSG